MQAGPFYGVTSRNLLTWVKKKKSSYSVWFPGNLMSFIFSQVVSVCVIHLALPACHLFFYRRSLFASSRQLEAWTSPSVHFSYLLFFCSIFPNKHTTKEMLILIRIIQISMKQKMDGFPLALLLRRLVSPVVPKNLLFYFRDKVALCAGVLPLRSPGRFLFSSSLILGFDLWRRPL